MAKHRPSIPLEVKLIAALRYAGLTMADVEFDHCPPLGLREYDETTRKYDPPANDPDKIVMRLKPDHRAKTHHPLGPHTTAGSDQHMIHKTRPAQVDKFVVQKPLIALPSLIVPDQKCRRCGEYPDACACPPPSRGSSFRQPKPATA